MSRDRSLLAPIMQILCNAYVDKCAENGINICITACYRTKEEQNKISSSKTQVKYPYSYHNWGLAFDVCNNDKTNTYPKDNSWWEKVGKIGEQLGLEWGGHWTGFVDKCHFQIDCYGTCNDMIRKYKTPDNFKTTTDYKVVTPTKAITPESQFRKIIWLQAMLNIKGYGLEIDGIYGNKTIKAVKEYYATQGVALTGKKVPAKYIQMLL